MGYYTTYNLSTLPEISKESEVYGRIRAWLSAREQSNTDFDSVVKCWVDESADETTWYEHEADMTALSEAFPEITFTLSGYGDEREDVWEKVFVGGAMVSSKWGRMLYPSEASTFDEMLEAMTELFEHCSMIHKHWGSNSNQKEADAAIAKGKAAIQKAKGEA
jgi:hypothetical protein